MNDKKPIKSKNLKVLDYKGTLYATFDGSAFWKLDKIAFGLLKMCDGKKTFDQIIQEVAAKASLSEEDVRNAVKPIFEELTNMKFIEWV
jgi:DNA-directed RNA polymerase delta subunit